MDVADSFAVRNDRDSIGGSVLRETVARDHRKYGHYHKNGFAHHTVLPSPAKNVPMMVYRGARNTITIRLTMPNPFPPRALMVRAFSTRANSVGSFRFGNHLGSYCAGVGTS